MTSVKNGLSPKQALYVEMLSFATPFVRNGLSNLRATRPLRIGFVTRKDVDPYYEVAELIHSVPKLIQNPEFDEADLWFMNHDAKRFYENADVAGNMPYEKLTEIILSLFCLLPSDLRYRLEWSGPKIH
jgi:hypothetical protein